MLNARIFLRLCCVSALFWTHANAQLSKEQKTADFLQLAAQFAKNYTPYEWKREVLKYDVLAVRPWLERVAQSKDDLDFYDICIEYVSNLEDGSAQLFLPNASFTADLRISTDIYDGKVLIDGVDRSALPAAKYPFDVGDEVVSLDGRSAAELTQAFYKYLTFSNPVARRRLAAGMIPFRDQTFIPRAHEIGDTAELVVLRRAGGMETYAVPWVKRGTPLLGVGPVPIAKNPAPRAALESDSLFDGIHTGAAFRNRDLSGLGAPRANPFPGVFPNYVLPSNFRLRLGLATSDFYLSGTFKSGAYTLGYVRIPMFDSSATALRQFQSEVAFFQQNTDGLIVDVTGTSGGALCTQENLLASLIPHTFQGMGYELRATQTWITFFSQKLQALKTAKAEQWMIDLYAAYLAEVEQAYSERGGKTGPLPLCRASLSVEPARNSQGAVTAYTKPMVLVTDELSLADPFAAIFQDEQRGLIAGQRTSGTGGAPHQFTAGNYSESSVLVTVNQMNRSKPAVTPDFPVTTKIENVGVRPDMVLEYQTLDNLLNDGATYVQTLTAAAVDWIGKNR